MQFYAKQSATEPQHWEVYVHHVSHTDLPDTLIYRRMSEPQARTQAERLNDGVSALLRPPGKRPPTRRPNSP